jgi:nicotinate-nucleotide adenylyltransferase
MRIGLFGGSFDPAHRGHMAVSVAALRRLRLDRVWWLVSPGNPLKPKPSADLEQRIAEARRLARHPRIAVTGLEALIGTRYTADTVAWLRRTCPGTFFVWIIGADALADFHRWKDWRRIADSVPMAVFDRPDGHAAAISGPAARQLGRARKPERLAHRLAETRPPAWIFLYGQRVPLSSTALRRDASDAPS